MCIRVKEGETGVYAHLEDSHYGPEKRVKVLPVWQSVSSIRLGPKLTTKQMHPQDTDTGGGREKEKTNRKQRGKCLHQANPLDTVQINRNKHSEKPCFASTILIIPAASKTAEAECTEHEW